MAEKSRFKYSFPNEYTFPEKGSKRLYETAADIITSEMKYTLVSDNGNDTREYFKQDSEGKKLGLVLCMEKGAVSVFSDEVLGEYMDMYSALPAYKTRMSSAPIMKLADIIGGAAVGMLKEKWYITLLMVVFAVIMYFTQYMFSIGYVLLRALGYGLLYRPVRKLCGSFGKTFYVMFGGYISVIQLLISGGMVAFRMRNESPIMIVSWIAVMLVSLAAVFIFAGAVHVISGRLFFKKKNLHEASADAADNSEKASENASVGEAPEKVSLEKT